MIDSNVPVYTIIKNVEKTGGQYMPASNSEEAD